VPKIDADQVRAAVEPGGDKFFTVGSTDPEVRYRVRADAGGPAGLTVVATSLEDVDAAVSRLVAVEAVATALVLGILALVAFWVLRLGVRPLKAMTRTATAIAGGGDLTRRVPDAPAGTEAGELGAALNTMLAHIQDSFAHQQASEDRLRRFVADASHELRTPVTTIRGYAELHRLGALDDPAELTPGDAPHRGRGPAHGRPGRRPVAAGPPRPGAPTRAARRRPGGPRRRRRG
jgi:two-component system OmpR family sensor kinase